MEQKQTAKEVILFIERIIRAYMMDDEEKLEATGFYDDDIDTPPSSAQNDILLRLEAYENILLEVLHMQGKKYFMEIVAEKIARQHKQARIKLTHLQCYNAKRLKS